MARTTQHTWKTVMIVAAVLLVIGMLLSGFLIPIVGLIVLAVLVVGGIALVRAGGSTRH